MPQEDMSQSGNSLNYDRLAQARHDISSGHTEIQWALKKEYETKFKELTEKIQSQSLMLEQQATLKKKCDEFEEKSIYYKNLYENEKIQSESEMRKYTETFEQMKRQIEEVENEREKVKTTNEKQKSEIMTLESTLKEALKESTEDIQKKDDVINGLLNKQEKLHEINQNRVDTIEQLKADNAKQSEKNTKLFTEFINVRDKYNGDREKMLQIDQSNKELREKDNQMTKDNNTLKNTIAIATFLKVPSTRLRNLILFIIIQNVMRMRQLLNVGT